MDFKQDPFHIKRKPTEARESLFRDHCPPQLTIDDIQEVKQDPPFPRGENMPDIPQWEWKVLYKPKEGAKRPYWESGADNAESKQESGADNAESKQESGADNAESKQESGADNAESKQPSTSSTSLGSEVKSE